MSQQYLMNKGKLLDNQGKLIEVGYALDLVREYNRADIKASKWRIKEWDYYYIGNSHYGVALTAAENSYMSMTSASLLDFDKKSYTTTSDMHFLTFGKNVMPSTIESGDADFQSKRVRMHFVKNENDRKLVCIFNDFKKQTHLEANLTLTDFPRDNMVIATPFDGDDKAFYYNAKVNCMKAEGYVRIGAEEYKFDKSDSLAVLDWGRGVWTYKNTWYWSSLNTYVDGKRIGFNLGYGFGNTDRASENMIFVDGIAHKTDRVTFNIPKNARGEDDYLSNWTITSNDNRVDLVFQPILDRQDYTNILIICSNQHQVFGKFNGKLVLDDGSVVQLQDNVGFAEKVYNKW
ncbi:MAG: DUF2804 domain-containing protein [Clostridia bacterium]|nr:DUF2804 domain-containing protein [Clostridia bacterium]